MSKSLKLIVYLLGFLLFHASPALFAQGSSNASGVDCQCSKTGDYLEPATGRIMTVDADSTSPHGKYSINFSGTTVINLSVIRVSDQATVYTTSFPQGSEPHWGFSPDDDRLVTKYTTGGSPTSLQNIQLIDLTKSSNSQIWSLAFSTMSDRIGFTKHGHYLYYNALYGTHQAHLEIVNAQTGDVSYVNDITYSGASGDDDFGMVTWGFSPDSYDRSFVYAYLSSTSYFQWYLVNLEEGKVVRNLPIQAVAGFWKFSPCGDVVGLVMQPVSGGMDISLYKTLSTQSAIGTFHWNLVDYVVLRATDSTHLANIGGNDYEFTDNHAGGLCVTGPASVTFVPDSVVGGNTVEGTVMLNGPTTPGSLVVSLSSSNPGAATVPSSVTVPAGSAEKTFTIETSGVTSLTAVAISASANGLVARDTLYVIKTKVTALKPDVMDVYGGDTILAAVVINHPAPPSGMTVKIVCDNPAAVDVPSSVTVSEGSTSKNFVIRTHEVENDIEVGLRAITGLDTVAKVIYIDRLVQVMVDPSVVVGGNSTGIYLTRGYAAPTGGLTYPVASSDSTVIAPGSLVLYQGAKVAGLNLPTHGVSDTQLVVLTTTAGSLLIRDTVQVLPASIVSNRALADSGCTVGVMGMNKKAYLAGVPILYWLEMDGEVPAAGADISLTSSRPDLLPVPAGIHLPPFTNGKEFLLISVEPISSPQEVVVTSSYRSVTVTDTITVVPKIPYTYVLIDSSESESVPKALTEQGDVMLWGGEYSTSIWRAGDRFWCPYGVGVNDSEQIVSYDYLNGDPTRQYGTILTRDTTIFIPHPGEGYENCYGRVINNHGDVAIYCQTLTYPYGPSRIGIWRNGTMTLVNPVGEYWEDPTDINDSGIVVGYGVRMGVYYYPIVWNGDTLTVIPLPAPGYGKAWAVNNHGVIVGKYMSSWFLRENGVSTAVPLLAPWSVVEATDINDSGVVIGTMSRPIGEVARLYSPFVMRDGYAYDLNCMVTLPDGWQLESGIKINNAGVIAATATHRGVKHACLLIPGNTTGVRDDRPLPKVPSSYAIEQNFPNPFNPVTTFRYQLPAESFVSLKVYNILGQVVATLIDGRQQAGYRTASWNAGLSGSGVYFYKLEAVSAGDPGKTFTSVKKMMLVK
jgi:hypothetical protein